MAERLEPLRFRHPVNDPKAITSYFAEVRPQFKDIHWGTDYIPLKSNENTLHAVNTGKVTREGWHDVSGNFIYISVDYIDGRKYQVLYAHMKNRSPLKAGDRVDIGQFVGEIGKTGNTTGVHCHVEIYDDQGRRRDPELWLENHRLISENRRLHNKIIDLGGDPT